MARKPRNDDDDDVVVQPALPLEAPKKKGKKKAAPVVLSDDDPAIIEKVRNAYITLPGSTMPGSDTVLGPSATAIEAATGIKDIQLINRLTMRHAKVWAAERAAGSQPPPVAVVKVEPPKPKKKAKPARADFKFIVFGDLHVSSKTLDRALDVLTRVGELAVHHEAVIVCTGDLWHARASLSVRQLNALMNVIAKWPRTILIPGNHDEVSIDGKVHAMCVFEPYEHVTVATEPLIDDDARMAFIPWREEAGEQERIIGGLVGDGWTIFGHAEVEGATTNHNHKAPGRVKIETLDRVARAAYFGHYHKRQKLGENTWYLGSPFEMDFGEMGDPKGVALITSGDPDPVFLDMDHFPKHLRVHWPSQRELLANARPQDITEIVMDAAEMRSAALAAAIAGTKGDVRPVIAPIVTTEGVPVAALTLDAAIDEWVKEAPSIEPERKAAVALLARTLVAEVADTKSIVPFGTKFSIRSLHIEHFCAIPNVVDIDLHNLGPVLLRGRMGVGKTSLCDAMTWCLFDTTTPRKAGASSASLKADEVIHDEADETLVRLGGVLSLPDGSEKPISIERTRKRGKGSKLALIGVTVAPGIADMQDLVHRILGMDVDLWRATVYLGQGAVANFITDADKRRKDLLARAFGLGPCEPVVKVVRAKIKENTSSVAAAEQAMRTHATVLDSLRGSDLTEQSSLWETQRAAQMAAQAALIIEERERGASLMPHIAHEGAWITAKQNYEQQIDKLTKALASTSVDARASQINAQLGGAHAERAALAKRYDEVRKKIEHYASPGPTCITCLQPIDMERHAIQAQAADEEAVSVYSALTTMDVRISNLNVELGQLRAGAGPSTSGVEDQLREARGHLAKAHEACTAIVRIRDALIVSANKVAAAEAESARLIAQANPFSAQAADVATKIAQHENLHEVARKQVADARAAVQNLEECEVMFSARGLPVLVLRTVIYELETYANSYLKMMLGGRVYCQVTLADDDLDVLWYEWPQGGTEFKQRSFIQLSGGQRRCAELAFSPFALAEMIFNRCGVRIPFLVVDELTTHLDPDTKPLVCEMLHALDRETVLVIDHDAGVRGEFDVIYDVSRTPMGVDVRRAAEEPAS